MKKVLLIIVGVVCSLNALALSYASPYKGAGRNGYIHSSAPIRSSMGSHSIMAQTPVATMESTSSYGMQTMPSYAGMKETSSDMQIRGIYTSASAIQGGVTTCDSGQRNVPGRRKAATYPLPDGACSHCQWEWVDDLYGSGYGGYVCSECGADILNGCSSKCGGDCTCDVPLDFNWSAMLFFASLAGAYAVYKKRTSTVQ